MKNLFLDHHGDIFLFTKQKPDKNCSLKIFITFLKYMGEQRPYFSYVPEICASGLTSQFDSYTLKEIIFSEVISDSFSLEQKIKKSAPLSKLLDLLQSLDLRLCQLSIEQKKIFEIVKGLLKDTSYLLLDHPDTSLTTSTRSLVASALLEQSYHHQRKIFIVSHLPIYWENILTHQVRSVELQQEQKSFFITPIPPKVDLSNEDEIGSAQFIYHQECLKIQA